MEHNLHKNTFKGIFAILDIGKLTNHDEVSKKNDVFNKAILGVIGLVKKAGEAIANALVNCKILQVLQSLWHGVKSIAGRIAKALGDLIDSLIEKMGNANFSGIIDVLNGYVLK